MSKIIYDNKSGVGNNLLSFNVETEKSILSKQNNVIVTDRKQLIDFVIEALSDTSSNKNLHLGIIPNKTISRIKMKFTDIKKR